MIASTLELEPGRRCQDSLPTDHHKVTPDQTLRIGNYCLLDQSSASPDQINQLRLNTSEIVKDMPPSEALDALYPPEHERCAMRSLVNEYDVAGKLGEARFASLLVDGDDPRSTVARRSEAKWFEHEFGTHPADHEAAFTRYSKPSRFIIMLDMKSPDEPQPAGVLRLIKPSEVGLKTLGILSKDTEENGITVNPWFKDFKEKIPGFELASAEVRKKMIYDFFDIDPETAWDIPTMAVDEDFKGHSPNDMTPAYGLYSACIKTAMAMGAESFINTQDYAPLRLMQIRFDRPWTDRRTLDERGSKGKYGFTPVPFDGPEPVVPTSMPDLKAFRSRIREHAPQKAASVFDVSSYGGLFKTPIELQADLFDQLLTQ